MNYRAAKNIQHIKVNAPNIHLKPTSNHFDSMQDKQVKPSLTHPLGIKYIGTFHVHRSNILLLIMTCFFLHFILLSAHHATTFKLHIGKFNITQEENE